MRGRTSNDPGIQLPSGNVFRLAQFSLDDRVIERLINGATAEDEPEFPVAPSYYGSQKKTQSTSKLIQAKHTGIFSVAYISHDGNRLQGLSATFYDDQAPSHVAGYANNERHGVLKKWDRQGRRVYYSQYRQDQPCGLSCYFHDDQPRLVSERKNDDSETLHLVSANKVQRSFEDHREAEADEDAKAALTEIASIEAELKEIKRIMIGKVLGVKRKSDEAQKQKLVSELNPAKRRAIADRINAVRAQRDATLAGLKRLSQ